MAFQAGAIVSQLTLDRSKFTASMRAVQKQTKKLSGWVKQNSAQFKRMGMVAAAAGAAALVVFKKMVKQYVEVGDTVHKMALRTGFAATTLSELAYAADISGADLTALEKGVKKMSKTIVDASYGLETYLRVFRSLGLDVKDLLKMSPEEQFLKLGAAIAEMESDTLRTAAAVDIFGRAGTMLLPLFKEGAEGIEKLREEAHKLGIIFDEEAAAKAAALKDAQTALKGSVQGLSIAILNDLIPVITDVVKQFTEWFVNNRKDAATWAKAIINFFKVIAQGIQGLMTAWGAFKFFVYTLGEEIIRHLARLTMGVVIVTGYTKKMGILAKTHEAAKIALKDLVAIGMGYNENADEQIEKLTTLIANFDTFYLTLDNVSEGLDKVKNTAITTTPALTALETKMARPLRLPPVALSMPKMSLEDFKKFYEQWLADLMQKWRNQWEKMLYWSGYFVGQLQGIFSLFSQNRMMQIENEYEAEKAAIENSTMNEMQRAKAIETLDAQMAKKRLAEKRRQAKADKLTNLLAAIVNTARAVTEALPDIPLAIAVGIMGAIQAGIIAAQPLPTFAAGGRMERGEPGIVGERGPEIFAPSRTGEIIPIRERPPSALGPTISFAPVFYLSTLDPQTARDVVRDQIGPELLEMFKTKIMLHEFQDALKIT